MTAPTINVTTGRALIPTALFDRIAARITAEHPDLPDGMPERILDQTLAFLGTCAVTTEPIGPSDAVDIGWHTFILYTHEYAEFCDRVAGRFIHHEPDDAPGDGWPTNPDPGGAPIATTVDAINTAGYQLDPPLWAGKANGNGQCTQCHAGCTDSPTR